MLALLAKTIETSPSSKLSFILKLACCLTFSEGFHPRGLAHHLIFVGGSDEELRVQICFTLFYILLCSIDQDFSTSRLLLFF